MLISSEVIFLHKVEDDCFQSSFIIQPFLDGFLQHFLSEGFDKEIVATCFQGSLLVVLVGIGRKGDDGDVRYQFTDDASGVDSAKVGHFHVHQDEVGVDSSNIVTASMPSLACFSR